MKSLTIDDIVKMKREIDSHRAVPRRAVCWRIEDHEGGWLVTDSAGLYLAPRTFVEQMCKALNDGKRKPRKAKS